MIVQCVAVLCCADSWLWCLMPSVTAAATLVQSRMMLIRCTTKSSPCE